MSVDPTVIGKVEHSIGEDEVVELARDMVRIPSVFGEEHRLAEFISSKLSSWGLDPRNVDVPGYGPDVVADYGDPALQKIVMNGHMDTVEVMSGWVHDPFCGSIEDGLLYGLGSLDMKSGLAAMMVALRAISEECHEDEVNISFQAVSAEEKDGSGVRALIKAKEFQGAKAVMVGEGFGGLNVVTNGRRGGSYYDIEVLGRSAHGAMPHLGVNAVLEASRVVQAVSGLEMPSADGLVSEDLSPLKESLTVLAMQGGTGSLTVPDRCTLRLVRCTVPGGRTDATDELVDAISRLGLEGDAKVTLVTDPKDLYLPYLTPPDSPLVVAARSAIAHHTGTSPRTVCGVSEADDNVIAHETGVPVICMGPGVSGPLARYHQAEEAIPVGQLGTAAKVFARTVLSLA